MNTARTEEKLIRTGIWAACFAVVFASMLFPPLGIVFSVTVAFVDLGLRTIGVNAFLLSMVLTFAALVLVLRLAVALAMRGYIFNR